MNLGSFFRNSVLSWFLSAALAVVVSSCGGSDNAATSDGDATPVKGDWIVVHELSDPEGLNPLVTNDASSSAIFNRVFEKLLEQDFETTDLYPVIAESRPTVSDDHLTYTFKIRQGVTFSDGKPLTARDVVFTFKAVKNPLITDAAALRNYYESMADISAPNDHTVVITMSKPYFLAEYFLGGIWILPKHRFDPQSLTDSYSIAETNDMDKAQANAAMKKFATWYNTPEVKRDPALNIGSGPYKYDEWKTGESVSIARNERWWNAGKDPWNSAYADKVIYKVVNDRSAAVVGVKNGEIDFMEAVPAAKFVEEIDTVATPFIAKATITMQIYSYVGLNCQNPILQDKVVRKALAHCLDRDALIKQVVRGLATPVNSPIYNDRKEYDKSITGVGYDPAKAKALLAQAGWSDVNGDGVLDKMINGRMTPFVVSILVNAGNEAREAIAVAFSDELRKVGVKLDVRKLEWSVFLENLRTRKFDLSIGAWVNDPIPSDPYQIWHSSQIGNKGSNYAGFSSPRADQLLEMNRVEFDESKRVAYMQEFQRIVADEQPYIFLWSPQYPAIYNKRLHGVRFSLVRPGYNPTQWWVPKSQWKYSQAQ
ncbi:MAG: ABC transporter substrate-binding protein [Candidatus Kapaibacterium sp.]